MKIFQMKSRFYIIWVLSLVLMVFISCKKGDYQYGGKKDESMNLYAQPTNIQLSDQGLLTRCCIEVLIKNNSTSNFRLYNPDGIMGCDLWVISLEDKHGATMYVKRARSYHTPMLSDDIIIRSGESKTLILDLADGSWEFPRIFFSAKAKRWDKIFDGMKFSIEYNGLSYDYIWHQVHYSYINDNWDATVYYEGEGLNCIIKPFRGRMQSSRVPLLKKKTSNPDT